MVLDLANSISTLVAHKLAAIYACSYVGSIYVSKGARLSFSDSRANLDFGYARPKELHERWRDDPDVIRARLVSVSTVTILCCLWATAIVRGLIEVRNKTQTDFSTALVVTRTYLGITSPGILPLFVTPVLYLGPLYACFLGQTLPLQRNWSFQEDVLSFFFSITGVRNFLVAPITEEIVFRACVLSAYYFAGAYRSRMIFLSPMVFGAAHVHHAWETYNRYGCSRAALKRAAIGTAIQFTYTTIFGFYCSYLFLRTGSIFPPIVAHVFCNVMGVPQPGYEISQRPDRKLAIILAYFVGIIGFMSVLEKWTHTEGNLYWP
ncbi:CAAX protease self-immunity-domain-containing protein [Scleroderma yunnanense]